MALGLVAFEHNELQRFRVPSRSSLGGGSVRRRIPICDPHNPKCLDRGY